MNFKIATWKEIEQLAEFGRVGPHVGIEAALLLLGRKPIWWCSKREGDNFIREFGSEFVCESVKDRFCVYHKDNPEVLEKFAAAVALAPIGGIPNNAETVDYHIQFGLALGFTEADIAAYLIHNYYQYEDNRSEFEKWQTGCVPSKKSIYCKKCNNPMPNTGSWNMCVACVKKHHQYTTEKTNKEIQRLEK
jgi:hypothetical protein